MKKKVVNKGYTLEIVSWENDADNYRTIFTTVDTQEQALNLYKLCTELFLSHHNSKTGIGNMTDPSTSAITRVVDFHIKNPGIISDEVISEDEIDDDKEEELLNYAMDLAGDLMGYSDFYICRVCKSCEIVYSDRDIYLEQIK